MLWRQRLSGRRAQLETSYQPRPAAVRRSSARSGTCRRGRPRRASAARPRRTRRASAVPSSTIRRVRRHVVGLARERRLERGLPVGDRLPRRAVDQVERLPRRSRPGAPTRPPPGPAAGRACGRGSSARGRRRTASRSWIRLKPAAAARSRSQAATLSGLASVVISTSGANPNSAAALASTAPRSAGGSSVGRAAAEEDRGDRQVDVSEHPPGRAGSRRSPRRRRSRATRPGVPSSSAV